MEEKVIRIKSVKQSILDGDPLAREGNIKIRCGDCIHYKGSPHPTFGEPCFELGVRPNSVAPDCYTPNVGLLRDLGPDAFTLLASFITSSTPQQVRIIAGLMRAASSVERLGFHFMQRVYFHIGGNTPTLDRVYSGHVLGIGLDKQVQVVGADYMRQSRGACVASLDKASLMNAVQFKKFKAKLIAAGQLKALDPKKAAAIAGDNYEPPTFETSPELLEAKANKTHRGKNKKDGKLPQVERRKNTSKNGSLFRVDESQL